MNLFDHLTPENPSVYHALDSDGNLFDQAAPSQLRSDALHLASDLLRAGNPGDRVIVPALPGLDFERAFFGVVAAGMIAVPLPKMPKVRSKKLRRIESVSRDCSPTLIVGDPAQHTLVADSFDLNRIGIEARGTNDATGDEPPVTRDADETVLLQYTSGSTGDPKGVCVSERNLVINQMQMARRCGVTRATDIVAWLPSFHDMGLCSMTIMPSVSGADLVRIHTDDFIRRPLLWLEAMRGRPDIWAAAPDFAYRTCVRALQRANGFDTDLSGWTFAANASEPVRESTMREFEEAFAPYGFIPTAFHPGYGLAESTVCVSVNEPASGRRVETIGSSSLAHGHATAAEPGEPAVEVVACGRPISGTTVKILDPDQPRELPDHAVGEICVSGPSNTAGYWQNPEATDQTFKTMVDGVPFLWTGDLGFLDCGEIFICGRKKDLIIHAGENYFASDLETEAAGALEGVESPIYACFQASDDVTYFLYESNGHDGPEDEGRRCHDALVLMSRLYPGPCAAVAVQRGQIPRTTSGKVQRRQAAALYEAGQMRVIATSQGAVREGALSHA